MRRIVKMMYEIISYVTTDRIMKSEISKGVSFWPKQEW
jgi:hypothetical protein